MFPRSRGRFNCLCRGGPDQNPQFWGLHLSLFRNDSPDSLHLIYRLQYDCPTIGMSGRRWLSMPESVVHFGVRIQRRISARAGRSALTAFCGFSGNWSFIRLGGARA